MSAGSPLAVVIIAAGQGTRMRSSLAKVLHPLAGRPLIGHVLALAHALAPQALLVVVGHQAEAVRAVCEPYGATCVRQEPQLGTGHAVAQTAPWLGDFTGDVLILYGDVPLLCPATARRLWDEHRRQQAAVTVLTARLPDPTGYGRIVRDSYGHLLRIVEERDATATERAGHEINSGIYCVQASFLFAALQRIGRANAQGEQYLTDIVAVAVAAQQVVASVTISEATEVLGVNTRVDLAHLEAIVRRQTCEALMLEGVTILDPVTTVIDSQVTIGRDSVIAPGTHLLGATRLGHNCRVGPHVVIQDSMLGDEVCVRPFAVIERTTVPAGSTIAPFTHLTSLESSGKNTVCRFKGT
jgi:bifunctional UDP-N-acetylglucosamine pyrophosphorylase/glucosamine-1-phosphate N-acetyltransferase